MPSANAEAPAPDERRRVGHDADDARAGGQRGFQFRERHAGGDGNQQMIAGERAANFREHGGDLVGLGRQNQDVREFGHVGVGRDGFRADFGGEIFARGVVRIAGDDFPGDDDFGADEAFGQGRGHFAGAEKTDFQWSCHESFVAGRLVQRKRKPASRIRRPWHQLQALGTRNRSVLRRNWGHQFAA